MRYIGDVHGKYEKYLRIISEVGESIQVGDFGMGFGSEGHNIPGHRFIRGNHDNPGLCAQSPQWIKDGTVEHGILYVGGAASMDRHRRVEGVDWWTNEEISVSDTYNIMDDISTNKIHTIVTHDCPQSFMYLVGNRYAEPTRTRQFFDILFEQHRPALWIFGHHHVSIHREVLGTTFVCLNELEYIDI
jgi:hypothetical protein